MPQSAEKVLDHFELFHQPEYQELLKNKKACFEGGYPDIKVKEVAEWTKTWEYREKNFAREALTVNPAKACQPLGAVFAAAGFEGSLSYVHGSQGCVAYFRSHLARHFKEPVSSVSDSMTEDAAVFGGMNNIVDGLANAYKMYNPKMIAMSTTCMAEVIGDDLHAFIANAKEKGSVPADFPVASCHTPSFVGSHITGYDAQVKGVLQQFWEGKTRTEGSSINIVGGFDGYAVGNIRELKRLLAEMGVEATFLADVSDVFDTPTDGTYRMYDGGTPLAAVEAALNAKATLSLQEYSTIKTLEYAEAKGQAVQAFHHPVGVAATDEFLLAVSKITGKAIPDSLTKERGRLVDAIADSVAHLHGKKFAIYGDPDLCLGLTRFLMELGAEPVHVLSTNGNKDWEAKATELLASSPFGAGGKAWAGKDLWHMRSLLFTEPVDFLIGNTYGKYLERDTGIPLIRIGFPIFDRHHHHRYPVWGYQGTLNVLVKILDKVFDVMDSQTNITGVTDISYDIIR